MRIRNREVDGVNVFLTLFLRTIFGILVGGFIYEASLPYDASQYRNCEVMQNQKYMKCNILNGSDEVFDRTKMVSSSFYKNGNEPYLKAKYCGDQLSNGRNVCNDYKFIAKTREEADRVAKLLIDGVNK